MINLGKFQGKGLTREFIVIHPNEHFRMAGFDGSSPNIQQARVKRFEISYFLQTVYGNSFLEIVRIHFGIPQTCLF
jgi:hypothetical protein